MGFWRAKHGLSKHGFKDQKLVSFGKKEQNVKEKEKRRRREEDGGAKIKQAKVWNFGFLVWKLLWVWIFYGSHGILRFCMVSFLSPKLGF